MTRSIAETGTALLALLTLSLLPGAFGGPGASPSPHLSPTPATAQEVSPEETTVVVRAVANDAKVIGSGVGGARITIRDAGTGEVLARGLQEGGTGSTERIMRSPRERGATVYGTEDAAKFEATLSLRRPTRVEIAAEGPLGTPHATQRASRTMILVPGRDVTGEGVILELYGLTVRLERPTEEDPVPAGEALPVRAHVEMLCGCPITPGGLWDADRVDVVARLVRDGTVVREASLDYAGETSTFGGRLTPPGPGSYELVVLAEDASRANAGMVRRSLRVEGAVE
ncbi:MAG: hypothetical protein ABEJ46_00630 [Gemmatimonadota bacterium]